MSDFRDDERHEPWGLAQFNRFRTMAGFTGPARGQNPGVSLPELEAGDAW